MAGLAATFRLLYSAETSFEGKLEAAESLVAALLDRTDGAPAPAAAALPPLVRAHYLRSLLDWSYGAVTKKSGEGAAADSKKAKKRKQQAGADAEGAAGRPPRLQPRCWALLVSALGSSTTRASQPLPAALLPAATAALQALRQGELAAGDAAEAAALLAQLTALLTLLAGKFAGTFRPSIEHAAAAAEAALSGHAMAARSAAPNDGTAGAAAQAWETVAAGAVRLLLAAAAGHPNKRKVWDATVPRLLPLLAAAGFRGSDSGGGGCAELSALCQQALEAVLFDPQHVPQLAAAAAAQMAAAVSEAEAASADVAAVEGAAAKGSGDAQQAGPAAAGYAAQLFAALQQQLEEQQLPLGLLPWMAGRFCNALRQHRRAAETEAAIAGQAGRRSQQAGGGDEEPGGDGGPGASDAAARPAGAVGGLSAAADFHFWVALLRVLLPGVQRLQSEGPQDGGAARLVEAVSGVAGLAGALREHQLYRPTQDPAGQHRLLLQRLADAALQLAQEQARGGSCGGGGGAAAAAVLPAALGVLRGILAVEHRVIQQQLPLLWPLLLWSPEAAGRGGDGGVAAAVAASLVAAFAELRQLQVLLQSLTAALLCEPRARQAAESAAAAVLLGDAFQAALAAAVRQLPSGQVPMLLRLAAQAVQQLAGSSGGSGGEKGSESDSSSAGQLLVLDLHSACLASLSVDLTTAAAAAAAAQALVAALGPALLPCLAAAAAAPADGEGSRKEKDMSKKRARTRGEKGLAALPALLRLYRHALAVHDHCAALHPEVAPLAGRHLQPAATVAKPGAPPAGYFAPLLEGRGGDCTAPQLGDVLSPARSGSGGTSSSSELQQALLQAAEQQLQLRYRQLQYLVHTCPVMLLPLPGAEGPQEEEQEEEEAEWQARQAQQQQLEQRLPAERRQAEAELRQLADCVARAVAEEAAGSSSCEPVALPLAARALPVLQAWAAPPLLQALLQACLRRAAAAGPDRPATQRQRLCRQLLLGGELLEQPGLAALLPAAVAAEQAAALGAVLEATGGAADSGEREGSAKMKRKKKRTSDAAAAAESGGSADSSGHWAELLQQLGRLAKGKAVKGSAWTAAVRGCSANITALAENCSSSHGSSSGGKKRKQQPGDSEGAPVAAGALQAVQQQAELLAQLPLPYLQPEAAASMAALSLGGLLCCCHASLGRQQPAAGPAALHAAADCAAVLARLAADGTGGSGGLTSQLQLLPQVLKAALSALACAAASGSSSASNAGAQQLAAAAEHSRAAMQAACAAHLAAADSSSLQQLSDDLSAQLARGPLEARCAAAVLSQACLAACCEAVGPAGSRPGSKAAAEIVCGDKAQPACGPAAAAAASMAAVRLEAAVAAALPTAAAAALHGQQQAMLAGALYGCSAQLLRLHCCDGPAADELVRQQQAGGSACISGMAGALLAAVGLLERLLLPAEQQDGAHDGLQGSSAAALLVHPVLEYVAACCAATGRMRPAASNTHYASLLALLLHMLARLPAGAGGPIPPSRQVLPFAAAFPAAAAEAAAAGHAVLQGGGAGVRPLLLQALRDLVAGSSSQQLVLPLRFIEAALSAAPASSGAALALLELLLVLLEAAGGSQQQRLLGQHSERVAALLATFVSTTCAVPVRRHRQPKQTLDSPRQVAASILAAAGSEGGSTSAGPAAGVVAPPTPPVHEPSAPAAAAPAPAELAALCTALRVLESLAARPKLFPLPPAAACSMLSSVTALWTAYAEEPRQGARPASWAAEAPLPGFCYRLDGSTGAGLFAGSCHLLMALLRHRQQDLRRCLPLLLQALRALLRFLAAAELSAKVQRLALAPAGVPGAGGAQQGQREQRWRVKCAELLSAVLAELAALREAGVGRYCPQLLADYLLLAAAPPSGRSKALLHFSSPAAALAVRRATGPSSRGAGEASAAAAAVAAEEDALAGEPLSPGVAAALRRGASALYGACSASEIQFLYASLGSGSGGGSGGSVASWRAALAALKSDYEKNFKYTGKV